MKYSFDFAVLFSNSLADVSFFTAVWAYCVISVSLGDNWRISWQLYVLQRKLQHQKKSTRCLSFQSGREEPRKIQMFLFMKEKLQHENGYKPALPEEEIANGLCCMMLRGE